MPMPPLKAETIEVDEPQDSTPIASVKKESATKFSAQDLQDAAAVAGHLDLPLQYLDDWTSDQKRRWLKCMLVKHINWHAMMPNQRQATAHLLNQVNASLESHSTAPLETLIGQVESILACQWLGQLLRRELDIWQLAAERESQSTDRRRPRNCSPSPSSDGGSSSSGSNGDLLWEHIVRMLETGHPAVRWLSREQGLFQFVQSTAAARSWGATKNNRNMSFEKMSRSIRQYYRPSSGLMIKVPNKGRLMYKLNIRHPQVLRFLEKLSLEKSDCCVKKFL